MLTVRKILNNSVVLCVDADGRECVAMGRGIAFLVPVGGQVDRAKVSRLFIPDRPGGATRLAMLVAGLPIADIEVTIAIAEDAGDEFGAHITDRLIVPLADHLSYALARARQGVQIDFPLTWETQALYPREVAFARRALDRVEQLTGVRLQELEAIPIALHLVNAGLGGESLDAAMGETALLGDVLRLIEECFGAPLDPAELNVARFVTHVRFLLARQREGVVPDDQLRDLLAPLAASHPREHACAVRVAQLVGARLGAAPDQPEELLLTLHIIRLVTARDTG